MKRSCYEGRHIKRQDTVYSAEVACRHASRPLPIHKSISTKRIRLPLSAYLSYVLIATVLFSGVSFSKFATTFSTADSATVAAFNVSYEGGGDAALSLTADSPSADYTFSVVNRSEVSIEYEIVVDIGTQLPDGVIMSLKKGSTDMGIPSNNGTQYIWDVSEPLAAGQNVAEVFTLTFSASSGAENGLIAGITVSVNAQQLD